MADEKISQLSDAGAPQDTDQLVIARSGSSLSLLFSALKAAIPGGVTSVFTRTGAVTAQSGDYTAAQVGALPSTETLDQIATANATAANWSNNSKKITSLANGSGAQDAAAFGQIPTALPPNGTAGGDLSGTYPNPAVKAITETSGPTDLTIGTIADGQFLKRSGSTLVSAAAGTGTVTSVTSADTSIAVATTTTTPVMTVAALNTIAANHATSGSIAMNTNKLTGLAAGTTNGDSVRYEQLPATAGMTVLVYRYTITGSSKASIDTGVDTPDAGSNDWTNCDLLEIHFYARSDKSATTADIAITLNNDTSAHYDEHWARVTAITASYLAQNANSSLDWAIPGATETASVFGSGLVRIQNPTGTTGFKTLIGQFGIPGITANEQTSPVTEGFRSTSAITRFKIAGTSTDKFVVGSQLLIYKRLAS